MIIREAVFIKSSTSLTMMPDPVMPEYAFVGRSNVGKSSLVNMLTQRNTLAKTSGKPGKTTLINHFLINESWYLVDLPGYGYAKRSKSSREQWSELMYQYLKGRPNLVYTFILVDARHNPQKNDMELMEWMAVNGLPFVIVFTKTDKLGTTNLGFAIDAYKKELLQQWEELPLMYLSSSVTKIGREDILQLIHQENESFGTYSSSTNT